MKVRVIHHPLASSSQNRDLAVGSIEPGCGLGSQRAEGGKSCVNFVDMIFDMRPPRALIWAVCMSAVAQVQPKRLPPASEVTSTQNTDYVYHVGHGVSAPSLIYKKEPEYSKEASQAGRQGIVTLSLIVGRDGRTRNIKVVRSVGLGLDEKAIQSVQTWKFKAGMKNGNAVPVYANVQVNFCILGQPCSAWKSAENSK